MLAWHGGYNVDGHGMEATIMLAWHGGYNDAGMEWRLQ